MTLLSVAACLSAGAAETNRPAAPYFNPFWAKSTYPLTHPQGDSTPVAGPTAPSHRLGADEIRFAPTGPANSSVGMYSAPYPNGKRVIWVGGYDRIAKVDADTLQILTTYSLGGKTYFGESEIERHIATMDKLDDKAFVDYAMKTWLEPWESVSTFYRLLNDKNEFYVPHRAGDGSTSIRVYGDEDPRDPASRIRLRREWTVPAKLTRATLCGVVVTSDGTLVISTMDGTMIALSQDFTTYTTLKLPAKDESGRTRSAKSSAEAALNEDILDTFVRNATSVDEKNGIYIASRDYLYRVQWTGAKLSLDEADGAWKVPYPNDSGRGTGTTPIPMGWGPGEDHLVIMGDGSRNNNAIAVWRDEIPADWKGVPGFDRRVAGITSVRFGVSKDEPVQLELAPVVFGYGAFFVQTYTSDTNNTQPMVTQDSPSKKWLAGMFSAHVPGYGMRGGSKIEWNPKTRMLATAWRSQTNFTSTGSTISTANGILYSWGVRNREWTLEGTDWNSGKNVFHYTLGKSHRFNPMGAAVELAPDGAVLCAECGLGLVRVMPKPGTSKRD